MRKLDLSEIHKYSLGCLCFFDKVCCKYGLKYSLAYGSLLGAVRHGGFIPWDDDIDVVMPRKDYDKLVAIFYNEVEKSPFYEFINEYSKGYYYTIGRIFDKRTIIKFTSNAKDVSDMGCFIDIYPMEGFSNNDFVRKMMSPIFKALNGYLSFVNIKKCNSNFFCVKIIKNILWFISRIIGYKFVYRLYYCLLLPWRGSSFLYNTWDIDEYVIPSNYFDNVIDIRFEELYVKAFADYDECLKKQYGDYMLLPPLEEQKPHHNYEAFEL